MANGGVLNLAVSISMNLLIYLTLEAIEEGNCLTYWDFSDIHGFLSSY